MRFLLHLIAFLLSNHIASGEYFLRSKSPPLDNEVEQPSNELFVGSQKHFHILNLTENNGSLFVPLGICEQGCRSDLECEDDLQCFDRSKNQTKTPGCPAESWSDVGICYNPNRVERRDVDATAKKFRIKLYWEKGYRWQGEKVERKWCMECKNSCKSGAEMKITHCNDKNDKFEFIGNSKSVQVKVSGTNFCLTLSGTKKIKLDKCSSSNNKQRFNPGKGDFDGKRFELFTSTYDGCLDTHHDPKNNEIITNDKQCKKARRTTSSYWNKY